MTQEIPQVKITVLKRTFHQDLVDEYLDNNYKPIGPCDAFKEGQQFIINPAEPPGHFFDCCPWAWADIYKDIMMAASGCKIPGYNKSRVIITGCTDWFKPVLFKVERLDD